MANWYACKFLESSENLRPLVRKNFGKEPSPLIARDIGACLQQGRLFYEAAASSPLEIRPLQLFYGMVGFAKAIILAHQCEPLSTLRHAHGVKDISTHKSTLVNLQLRIKSVGTFQKFNDVIGAFTRLNYIDDATVARVVPFPSAKSVELEGFTLTLKEILARIPQLRSVYKMTFREDPLTEPFLIITDRRTPGRFSLRFDDQNLFTDRESLRRIVSHWRDRFPFLRKWRVCLAQRAWGYSLVELKNTDTGIADDLSDPLLVEDHSSGKFSAVSVGEIHFAIEDGMNPLAGFTGSNYAIAPVNGRYISEFSFQYLALYLLSSLVRYRPETWMHTISRWVLPDTPADDFALSLVEQFLEENMIAVPDMVVKVLNPTEAQGSANSL